VVDPRLKKLVLEGMLLSYESVTANKIHRGVFENAVPGVLRSYDLPDLVGAVAPRQVWIANSVTPMGQRSTLAEVRSQYSRALDLFKLTSAENQIWLGERNPDHGPLEAYPGLFR